MNTKSLFKNRFAEVILLVMFSMLLPTRHFAQQPRVLQNQSVIEFDVTDIAIFDERVFFIYNLVTDGRFDVINGERDGVFVISADEAYEGIDLGASFADFRHQNAIDFSRMDKEQAAVVAREYKNALPNEFTASMMMDIYIRSRENNTCANADPFCTDNGMYQFPAGVNAGSGEAGPDYSCLYSQPNPAWYYLQIDNPGNIDIYMYSTPSHDIDFCCWGPFADPTSPCPNGLTSDKVVSCSYSASATEHCLIPASAQTGDYFILVITNYSNQSCNISFSKVAGTGTTNCDILPPLVDNSGPYCVGETINLTANGQAGATYSWTGPGGFSSNQQNPTRPNCTMAMAGTYTCTITLGSATNSATTEVVVHPQPTANFNFTTVCQGTATQFTSTSTTNPSGQTISGYQWNFGDGQTSTQQNPTHLYNNAGTFSVTLTVNCNGHCTNSITKQVTVYASPNANAGPDQTIPYNTSTQLSGSGGAGSFSFHWEPANMVVNPNAQNTQTVALTADQTYTLTVTNSQGGCTSSDQVTIHINGGALTVSVNANPSSICMGGSTQLTANAGGGMGNSTYSWTPTTGLSNPNIYNPIASPTQTTTYTCTVTNPQTNQTVSASVTVVVNDIIVEDEYATICPDEIYQWHGSPYTGTGVYSFDTVTDQGCEKTIYLHLDNYPTFDETVIDTAICFGETYTFYGTTYNSSIVTSHTDQTIHGCDSIVRLNLTVWDNNGETEHPVTVCPSQLPYYYEEDPYEIPLYEGFHYFHLDDVHGCDSTVIVILSVSDYYIPPVQTEYVCYQDTPSFTWDVNGVTYHDDIFVQDTLPYNDCDGIYRLDLHFQQIPEAEHTYVDDACDSYYWPVNGQTYTSSGEYSHSVSMAPYPCSQEYRLHLTLHNSHTNAVLQFNNECDEVPFEWFGSNPHIVENGTYNFSEGTTTFGCDTAMRVVVQNMRYTPDPTHIQSTDANAMVVGDTISVITETEFFSFNYDFFIAEQGRSIWDECEWSISKPSWRIEPTMSLDHKSSTCKVYVAERDHNLVELVCKVRNNCMEPNEYKIQTFYLKSSYVGVEELAADNTMVNIIPNPNSGQMWINFEQMRGRINVKVFDMKGNMIDTFETNVNSDQHSYEYNMKRYAEGLYLFVISDNQRSVTRKVVVTK
ncbi:MAG: PKD domain-containing protein [Bacteroidales bacterium]|nr:PKD domain-containing protein [Bacteroidales bacterium]